uniref:Ig-like domain-containing protein n=1 Tax=Plectus sambesii TaxID=2011161 RepID=A0A914W7A8_9BILA
MTRNLVIVAMVMAAWVWSTNGQPRPPSLTSSSSSVLLREGQNLTLECPVDGAGDLRVQWFRNEQPATEKGSLFRRLTIDAVSRADAGAYRCSAENDVGALVSRAVNVTVSYLDDFGAVPEEFWQISASVGGYFVLTPPPLRANPLHDIAWRWYFHDAVVFPNRTHFVSSTGTLVVLEASAEKAGPYKVEATSALGRVSSRDYVVEMNSELQNGAFSGGDPTIALAPRDTVFVRTSGQRELVLECVAFSRSLDEVVINWHHNGTRIVPDGIQYELEQFSRRLRVNNPSFPKNSGVYACEATRSFTSAKGQAWVEIYEEPEITSTMPPETPGSLGQSITLPCRARGWPRPLLKWFKNAVPTSKSIAEDGSLIISSVTEEDKGIYQCEAINAAGSTLSTTWLRTEASGPVLSERPNNVSVTVGQEAKFL